MLEYLVTYNSTFTYLYIEVIADMKCPLHLGGKVNTTKTRK